MGREETRSLLKKFQLRGGAPPFELSGRRWPRDDG